MNPLKLGWEPLLQAGDEAGEPAKGLMRPGDYGHFDEGGSGHNMKWWILDIYIYILIFIYLFYLFGCTRS